jgi:hypothetical protein
MSHLSLMSPLFIKKMNKYRKLIDAARGQSSPSPRDTSLSLNSPIKKQQNTLISPSSPFHLGGDISDKSSPTRAATAISEGAPAKPANPAKAGPLAPSVGLSLSTPPPASPDGGVEEAARPMMAAHAPLPLKRCGALICLTCGAHSPSPHRDGCALPHFDPCRSRWFWMGHYRAVKCVRCESPADLRLVEAWILARETGEGDDGWRIPGEVLSLLRAAGVRSEVEGAGIDRLARADGWDGATDDLAAGEGVIV